ncbi:MAG TPA: hypothetical protein V6D09_03740 [Leptolyngbyaceae cyanobacterium]
MPPAHEHAPLNPQFIGRNTVINSYENRFYRAMEKIANIKKAIAQSAGFNTDTTIQKPPLMAVLAQNPAVIVSSR